MVYNAEKVEVLFYSNNGKVEVIDQFSGQPIDYMLYNTIIEGRCEISMAYGERVKDIRDSVEEENFHIADQVTDVLSEKDVPYVLIFLGDTGEGNMMSNIQEQHVIVDILENVLNKLDKNEKKGIIGRINELLSREAKDEN